MMALKFIAVFGIMGIPVFVSLATCNEVSKRFLFMSHAAHDFRD